MRQILTDMPEHQYNAIMEISSADLGEIPYKGIVMWAINAGYLTFSVVLRKPTTRL